MCLSSVILTSIKRTSKLILVELLDLVNFVIIFLSPVTLLGRLTFLLGFLAVTRRVRLFWIYFYLLMLVFVLQWLFLHCEILIIFLFQTPPKSSSVSLYSLWLFSCWLGRYSWLFHGKVSLSSVLLLLLLNLWVVLVWNWCIRSSS